MRSGSWGGFHEHDKKVMWKIAPAKEARSAIWEAGYQMKNSFIIVGLKGDPESEHLREWWSGRKAPGNALFIYLEADSEKDIWGDDHRSNLEGEMRSFLGFVVPRTAPFGIAIQPYEKDDPFYSMCGPSIEYRVLKRCAGTEQCGPALAKWLDKVD